MHASPVYNSSRPKLLSCLSTSPHSQCGHNSTWLSLQKAEHVFPLVEGARRRNKCRRRRLLCLRCSEFILLLSLQNRFCTIMYLSTWIIFIVAFHQNHYSLVASFRFAPSPSFNIPMVKEERKKRNIKIRSTNQYF